MTKRSLPVVNTSLDLTRIRVATPCEMKWEDLQGESERERHCNQCSLDVYNFAGMQKSEIADVLSLGVDRVCARLLMRKDGTFLTQDCPVGLAEKVWKRTRNGALMAAASMISAVIFVLALMSFKTHKIEAVVDEIEEFIEPEYQPVAGGLMEMPPPQKMGKIATFENL